MIEIPWSERSFLDDLLTHHQPLDDDAEETLTDSYWEDNPAEDQWGEREEEEEGGRPLRHPYPRHIG